MSKSFIKRKIRLNLQTSSKFKNSLKDNRFHYACETLPAIRVKEWLEIVRKFNEKPIRNSWAGALEDKSENFTKPVNVEQRLKDSRKNSRSRYAWENVATTYLTYLYTFLYVNLKINNTFFLCSKLLLNSVLLRPCDLYRDDNRKLL